MKKLSKLIIGIGGNVHSLDGLHPIEVANEALKKIETSNIHVDKVSSWYVSQPIPKSDQPNFFNCVAFCSSQMDEFNVLNKLQLVEYDLGRTRVNVNEPRSIDLDLIDFSGKVVNTKNLILPHPRAHLRKFVMEPIAELEPMWIHPINKLSAKFLSNELNNQIIMIYDKYKNFD